MWIYLQNNVWNWWGLIGSVSLDFIWENNKISDYVILLDWFDSEKSWVLNYSKQNSIYKIAFLISEIFCYI